MSQQEAEDRLFKYQRDGYIVYDPSDRLAGYSGGSVKYGKNLRSIFNTPKGFKLQKDIRTTVNAADAWMPPPEESKK